jgi:hypothetical protein
MRRTLNPFNYLFFLAAMLCCNACEEEKMGWTLLVGSVQSVEGNKEVHSAFLILGDELLATSKEDGSFEIDSLEAGSYSLLCSSLGFHDTLVQLEVREGSITNWDIFLTEDYSRGWVYGELHDAEQYQARLTLDSSMSGWTGKELFDGVSGATIQTMTFGYDLPAADIYVGDSLLTKSDGFGQYWTDIQSGTYPIRVSMPGWEDHIHVIHVEPDSIAFCNFILSQQKVP